MPFSALMTRKGANMAEVASHNWSRSESLWKNEVFTVKEAAQVLYVSTPTVYRMIRDGILTPAPIMLGTGRGVTVIPRAEIEHYITSLTAAARRLTNV